MNDVLFRFFQSQSVPEPAVKKLGASSAFHEAVDGGEGETRLLPDLPGIHVSFFHLLPDYPCSLGFVGFH